MTHPNAAAAAASAWIAAALIYLLGLFGVSVPDPPLEVAIGLGGIASALALFIGRRGVRGLVSLIWRGQGD